MNGQTTVNHKFSRYNGGWIELIFGCMSSGKTEELIRRVRRAEIAGLHVQVFKPKVDTRYEAQFVSTHEGLSHQAIEVEDAAELYRLVALNANVVAIDEVQFFDWKIAEVVEALANRGVRVICAGLDQDFKGEPFGPIPLLVTLAEEVTKLQAICVICGAPATRTQRIINGVPAPHNSEQVVVGGLVGEEHYEARCRRHHEVPGKPEVQL